MLFICFNGLYKHSKEEQTNTAERRNIAMFSIFGAEWKIAKDFMLTISNEEIFMKKQ